MYISSTPSIMMINNSSPLDSLAFVAALSVISFSAQLTGNDSNYYWDIIASEWEITLKGIIWWRQALISQSYSLLLYETWCTDFMADLKLSHTLRHVQLYCELFKQRVWWSARNTHTHTTKTKTTPQKRHCIKVTTQTLVRSLSVLS